MPIIAPSFWCDFYCTILHCKPRPLQIIGALKWWRHKKKSKTHIKCGTKHVWQFLGTIALVNQTSVWCPRGCIKLGCNILIYSLCQFFFSLLMEWNVSYIFPLYCYQSVETQNQNCVYVRKLYPVWFQPLDTIPL